MMVDRQTVIQLRRGLIDRVTSILPTCDLFKESAIYPRRYFDDLMIELGGQRSSSIKNIQRSAQKVGDFPSSPNLQNINLNSNSSNFLPSVNNLNSSCLPFGIGDKSEYEIKTRNRNRKQNQSMTIDVYDINSRQDIPYVKRRNVFDNHKSVSTVPSARKIFNQKRMNEDNSKKANLDIDSIMKSRTSKK